MKHFKYSFVLIMVIIMMFLLVGCGPKTGVLKGMEIYVTTGEDVEARSTARYFDPGPLTGEHGQSSDFYHPKDLKIAFNKVWFVESDTYDLIKNETTNEISNDKDNIIIKDRTTLPSTGFYKPINEYTVITASESEPFEPNALPEYGMEYKGVLIDIVFVEYVMEDFSIRWYSQDYGDYKANDVVLFNPDYTTGLGKFPYYYRTSDGDVSFEIENERKVVETDLEKLKPHLGGGPNTFQGYFSISGGCFTEHPIVIAGHATASNPEPVNNPTIIETFGEDENEAQYYLLQICLNADADFSIGRFNGFEMGPGLKANQTETDSLDYDEFIRIIDVNLTDTDNSERDPLDAYPDDSETTWIRTVVSAVGSGIGTRFGWIDFEGNPQGEFSPNAGW
ncbi:MAG: hypothetical protein WDA14_08065 [Sphaerochaetaceae bacterium]|jgi:hypothetical protein|nr:hypothetical protein [Sphaerochaetaceae bacterium]MDD3670365.1 hypothetical protein [Sphaerochaetaceae bacterium]MDD4259246.1 hypothetical protein [Sphaerochaetaceae bacterium]MDD4841701.1 hypothetical protein [Sphaerochaetaceae bacterium]